MSSFSQKRTDADTLDGDKDSEDEGESTLEFPDSTSTGSHGGDNTNDDEEFEYDASREAADSREIEDIIHEVEEKLAIDETEERQAKYAVTNVC